MVPGTDGVELALYDLSSPDVGAGSPVVVLCHATGFCAQAWNPLAAGLRQHADEPLRILALDFRAHGRSSAPADGNLSWVGVARDVRSLLDHFEVEQAFGIGHSMGGAALILAELDRPETFSGIWAFEPIVIPPEMMEHDNEGNFLSMSAARRRPRFDSLDAARANFESKPPMMTFVPGALEGYLDGGFEPHPDGSVTLRCLPQNEAEFYMMGGRNDAWLRLGEVATPTWIVMGSDAFPGPPTFAPLVADRLPKGQLVVYPDMSHFGPFEAPETLAVHALSAMDVSPPA